MKKRLESAKKHGDTIIEVTLSITIFSLLAVLSLNLMNNGISNAQRTLEITMARNEIDAQAEALRYIHSSYVAERQLSRDQSQFRKLWDELRDKAIMDEDQLEDDEDLDMIKFDINNLNSCSEAYGSDVLYAQEGSAVYKMNSFVLNTRLLLPDMDTTYAGVSYDVLMKDIIVAVFRMTDENGNQVANKLYAPTLYPRIIYSSIGDSNRGIGSNSNFNDDNDNGSLVEDKIYNRISRAEGIWIVAAGDQNSEVGKSSYYDFYIRTCWHSVGDKIPSTITTIVRLYNPEVIE